MNVFTYEYVTIHLILITLKWRRSWNRCSVFGGLADRDLRQLELIVNSRERLGLDEEEESEKPVLGGKKCLGV